jgi:hypothetical protein
MARARDFYFFQNVQTSSVAHPFDTDILIYLLTAIGLSPGGSSTHLHTNNTYNDTNNQYIEQHNNWRVRAMPRLG